MIPVILLLLTGCPKPGPGASNPMQGAGAGETLWESDGPTSLPDGWTRADLPTGIRSIRVSAGHTEEDGSVTLGGSAERIAQYQWVLRVPALGEPSHLILDPGRVEQLRDNNTGGMLAVGVLGGVPEDKAWYADIDAFGNISTRQTYLSDGEGSLRALASLQPGLLLAGELTDDAGRKRGWLVKVDEGGRDVWKKQLGDAATQSLSWGANVAGVFVATGHQGDADDDAWVIAVDSAGEVLVDLRFPEPEWTRLSGGVILEGGDLLAVGTRGQSETSILDGRSALYALRVAPSGAVTWERQDRGDLSLVSDPTPWQGGAAVAALRGALGTDRAVVVATLTSGGEIQWQEVDLGMAPQWAQVFEVGDQLVLLATHTDEYGVAWTRRVITGG